MTAVYYVTPTDYGLSLIAQAHETESITLSGFVMGDANGTPYDPVANKSRTSLVNQRAVAPIQSVQRIGTKVEVRVLVGSNIGGFNIHEIGLTDSTGKLVYIGNYHGGYKPQLAEGAVGEIQYIIVIQAEQGSQVLVQAINPVTASQNWVLEQITLHTSASDPHPQYATDFALDEVRNYILSLLLQHASAANPHPQYLLASTFGVDLPMSASANTAIDDKNCVFGWNGESGANLMFNKSIRWWNVHDETATFKPFRAYGYFLLAIYCQPEGDGYLELRIFDKNDVMIAETLIWERHDTSFAEYVKHVFYLRKGDYAQVRIHGKPWNDSYAEYRGSVYVDDRVKTFSPVGYQSSVNAANSSENGSVSTETPIDYSTFPASEWSYLNGDTALYVALNSDTTFATPENHVPHYHRALFTDHPNTELWIAIEVGKQTIETPSDYIVLASSIVRGDIDANGNIVAQIPFSMRAIDAASNETIIYQVAYYLSAVTKAPTDPFPAGSIDGIHKIYVKR